MASNGPISVTTIGDPGDYPEPKEYEFTIKIRGTYFRDEKLPKNLGLMVNNFLRAWRDGRRPLDVEILHDAFERILKSAANECLAQELQAEFPNEYVVSEDGRNKTAKWYVELQNRKAPSLPYLQDDWECKIERAWTEEDHKAFRDAITKSDEELAS